uniref:WH2 domain-containing protein n=1 Tax=Panagrolaimus sp. PS1159 TaxID=55785 RepID=A0AC35G1I7_9BILA
MDMQTNNIHTLTASSPKQTKLKQKKEEDFEIPPAIPQSAPPDPIAVATALSFTSTKQSTASSVKRLSNFGLSPAKVPPIPVSQFEDLTDSSSDSGNSTNIIMPVYTNVDLKHQLHIEHKKLLSLYEEWEMLRRPQYSSPNDGLTFANIMTKQEAVLRQHAIVTSLYNQLLAPVVSNNSSPASTLRLKPAPPRHIINPTNSNPPTLSRGYTPSLYKSLSTYDVMNGENNNIKKEPERNYQPAGNYSPRISQTKRYSAGDVLNPIRPRLGSTETSENSNNHRYDERKKYVVEQKSVVRNVPIMTSLPKLMNTNIIINTEPKRNVPQSRNNNFTSYSPPVAKRELTPVNEKPIKKMEVKKENIEIKKQPPQTLSNNIKPKNSSPLIEKKVMKYPSPPNYSPKLNNHQQQHYYANSPPTTKKQVVANGFHHPNHSTPHRQISLPEVIQKQAAKPPTPIQTKKVIATPKSSPTKTQPQTNNDVHGDLLTSISAFPNITLRSVPKPVEKSFNLGRVLENGERPSSYYREQEEELPTKSFNGTGPPAPPPPPPPPLSGATLKKSNAKQAPKKNSDADALRGDMLAEIRKAGGIQFLRSISTK